MIGNDIVDLVFAKMESNWRRRGYVDKIFTQSEQMLIEQSSDADTMVWILWSIKESVYKAIVRTSQKRFYQPKLMEVLSLSEVESKIAYKAIVNFQGQQYQATANVKNDYVHTVACVDQRDLSDIEVVVCKNYIDDQIQQSSVLKLKIIAHIAQQLQLKANQITMLKDASGVPVIHVEGRSVPLLVSLSHHGRYGAYVIDMHGLLVENNSDAIIVSNH